MKYLFILIAITVFSLCYAQDIPKKSNVIKVETSKTFKDVVLLLMENGYSIENSDGELGIITTGDKPFKNGTIRLNIIISEKEVTFTGSHYISAIDAKDRVHFGGMKNSPLRLAWDEMHKTALLIGINPKYLTN